MSSRALVLGTAGHVDHGKTTLIRALTGVDTDRWREEKERGLTIDIGFAPLALGEELEVGVVDVPGHQDFLKNMLAGATGVDLLLLAVAADEGPMPQTREHLSIASLLGLRHGVVALTKTDRVEDDWLDLVREATREELLRTLGHADWPLVPVSALRETGLDVLRERLREGALAVDGRPEDDLFRLPVDRSFTIHGTGTVITGTVWSGAVEVGQDVRILPDGPVARVRSLQVHGTSRSRVAGGRRCALALVGVDPDQVPRGRVAVRGAGWRPVSRLAARVRLLPNAGRPLEHGQRVRVHHGTREELARVQLPGKGSLAPGSIGWGLLRLERPAVVRVRDRFVIRFYSPVITIGGGEVAELDPPRAWTDRTGMWRRVLDEEAGAAFAAAVELKGVHGMEDSALALATGVPAGVCTRLRAAPPDRILSAGGRWYSARLLDEAARALCDQLERLHRIRPRARGASLEGLRASAGSRFGAPLVERALERLTASGDVVVEGPTVRLPGHRPTLTRSERTASDRLVARLAESGAEPPTLEELAGGLNGDRELLHDLLRLLEEDGRVRAVTPDLYVTAEVADRLERQAREVLAAGAPAPPTAFKEAFGVSRKYLIPILEYLDRRGITRRTAEGRTLAG